MSYEKTDTVPGLLIEQACHTPHVSLHLSLMTIVLSMPIEQRRKLRLREWK